MESRKFSCLTHQQNFVHYAYGEPNPSHQQSSYSCPEDGCRGFVAVNRPNKKENNKPSTRRAFLFSPYQRKGGNMAKEQKGRLDNEPVMDVGNDRIAADGRKGVISQEAQRLISEENVDPRSMRVKHTYVVGSPKTR
jgi:hypothetical protein